MYARQTKEKKVMECLRVSDNRLEVTVRVFAACANFALMPALCPLRF